MHPRTERTKQRASLDWFASTAWQALEMGDQDGPQPGGAHIDLATQLSSMCHVAGLLSVRQARGANRRRLTPSGPPFC